MEQSVKILPLSLLADEFFEPKLREAGYTGLFWPKACSPAEQYGYPCDGCALFFKTERFETLTPACGETSCLLLTAAFGRTCSGCFGPV